MDIYTTIIKEYCNQHNDANMDKLLKLNITIPTNISDDYAKRYVESEYMLCELSDNFTSYELKELSEISKSIYKIDYIGYPELTTLCKAYTSFPDYNLNNEQMNFIFEGIKYIYDNYPHELP